MKRNMLCLLLFSLILIQINGISILTGENNKQGDQTDGNTVPTKRADILQQLLNQETIIRMSLEKSVRDLMKEVANMKTKITMLETSTRELSNIQMENQQLERNHLSHLKENLTRIEESFPELLTEKCEQMYVNVNRSLEIMDNELISRHKQLLQNVSNLEMIHRGKQDTSVNRAVAFDASLTANRNTFTGRVVFGKVALNAGNGYDGSTGIFTAPQTGIYVFEWTTVVWAGKVSFTLLNAGGQKKRKNHCFDKNSLNNFCSRMSVVKLNEGEKAWIETYSGTALDHRSSIACFML
ncbi:multimerin-2-like isoform X1 [Saccostrea cucullata]|uniref:multimerin-2-like isoform X1 n=1 Tax=Saccostrea cuccullata TaxID=36930 RepID=UPI002ED44500